MCFGPHLCTGHNCFLHGCTLPMWCSHWLSETTLSPSASRIWGVSVQPPRNQGQLPNSLVKLFHRGGLATNGRSGEGSLPPPRPPAMNIRIICPRGHCCRGNKCFHPGEGANLFQGPFSVTQAHPPDSVTDWVSQILVNSSRLLRQPLAPCKLQRRHLSSRSLLPSAANPLPFPAHTRTAGPDLIRR